MPKPLKATARPSEQSLRLPSRSTAEKKSSTTVREVTKSGSPKCTASGWLASRPPRSRNGSARTWQGPSEIHCHSARRRCRFNSFMRRARSLFAADILRHLAIELPEPRPFAGVAFEPRQSLKYRSNFDVLELIKEARSDLAESDPELFKIFLLAVMVGLRRKEIDLLEWPSFKRETVVIRIEPTHHFHPKSEDSIGDVPVDKELMEIFRGYRARAKSDFVIESAREPKAGLIYDYYRCQEDFEKLAKWLRKKGVKVSKPLHTLRKEYGSQINAIHGIHAASRALRHADIRVTNEYYTDSRARVTPGMGHLLKDDDSRDGDESDDKITELNRPAELAKKPVKRKESLT